MKQSDSIKELATALASAQGELEGAVKDSNNPAFKSKYADLASVVAALKAAFPKHGLSYIQTIVTAEHGVGVETMLMHKSGEWVQGEAFAIPVSKQDAHGFGSALTYARRYSLSAITGVAPEDDDGNAAVKAPPQMSPQRFADFCTSMADAALTSADALRAEYTKAVAAARAIGDATAEKSFTEKKDFLKQHIKEPA